LHVNAFFIGSSSGASNPLIPWPASKTTSTSSKKKKRKDAASSQNKRHEVFCPVASPAKARKISEHSSSDGDDSYHGDSSMEDDALVHNISRVRLADDFLIGQVHTWSKEVLW
jgi:hypothetical protein